MKYYETTAEELSLILEKGEGYRLEFKQSINSDLPKEIVAFANASGGRIFIGVNDQNQIVGCDISNKAVSQIEQMASSCDPPVAVKIEKIPDIKILVVHVPEGANRPHRCNKGFYLRNGANSQKMNTNDITSFIQAEGNVRFDEQLRLDLDWQEALAKENCQKVNIRYNTMFTLEFPRPTYQKHSQIEDRTGKETRKEILKLISENPKITSIQMAETIGSTQKSVEWQISQLKKDGLIKRIGPTKGGEWVIIE